MKDEKTLKQTEDERRSQGLCVCGKPVSVKVKNASMCDACREDMLGDLAAA
jgi:hypothetical protein